MTEPVKYVREFMTIYHLPMKGADSYIDVVYKTKWHRYDGPAVIDSNLPEDEQDWYIKGKYTNGREYQLWLFEQGMDINNLSDNDKVLIDIKWGPK